MAAPPGGGGGGGGGGEPQGDSQTLTQQEQARRRQDLTRQYRSWSKKAEYDKGRLEDPLHAKRLVGMVLDLNELHRQTPGQASQVQTLDSNAFSFITERGVRMTQKLNEGLGGLTLADLQQGLRARYGDTAECDEEGCLLPEAFDWLRLGRLVGPLFRPAPGFSCLLGPLARESKAAIKRATKERQPKNTQLEQLVNPEELDTGAEENTTETTRDIEAMYNILRREEHREGVSLLRLFLDHDSFAKTVENLFALSFLVRDGRAELQEVTAGGEYRGYQARVAVPPPRQGAPASKPLQFILSYDMDDWEDWKQACPRARTLMPPRAQYHRTARAAAGPALPVPTAARRSTQALEAAGSGGRAGAGEPSAAREGAALPDQAAAEPEPGGARASPSRPKKPRTKLSEKRRASQLAAEALPARA